MPGTVLSSQPVSQQIARMSRLFAAEAAGMAADDLVDVIVCDGLHDFRAYRRHRDAVKDLAL